MVKAQSKYMQAPLAPRRFKSSFIFYSAKKHKELRREASIAKVCCIYILYAILHVFSLDRGTQVISFLAHQIPTPQVAKMVSRSWKALTPKERAHWDKLAERDKARFEVERSHYKGPWQVIKKGKATTNNGAPKRPMSAFLAFVESHRKRVKADFPKMNAVEITSFLSKEWKAAPEKERAFFYEKNRLARQMYEQNMVEYKELQESDRKRREEAAEKEAIQVGLCPAPESDDSSVNTDCVSLEEMGTPIQKVSIVSSEDMYDILDLSSPNNVIDSFQDYLNPVLRPEDQVSLLRFAPQATSKYHERNIIDKKEDNLDALLLPPLPWDVPDWASSVL